MLEMFLKGILEVVTIIPTRHNTDIIANTSLVLENNYYGKNHIKFEELTSENNSNISFREFKM